MREIGDDPIVRCMERCGCPPWMLKGEADEDERDSDCGEDDDGKL